MMRSIIQQIRLIRKRRLEKMGALKEAQRSRQEIVAVIRAVSRRRGNIVCLIVEPPSLKGLMAAMSPAHLTREIGRQIKQAKSKGELRALRLTVSTLLVHVDKTGVRFPRLSMLDWERHKIARLFERS